MRGRSRLSVALIAAAVLFMSLGLGCASPWQLTSKSLTEMHIQKPVKQLAAANPGQFKKSFTLLVLTDETATCGMREARWWRDWESFMNQHGWGFILATSKEDSLDLVVAAQMDSVHAPTLVVPSCKQYLAEVGFRFAPINLLVDSTADIYFIWTMRMDTAGSRQLMDTIPALVAEAQRPKQSGQ
jgi:hypothetical protein